MLKEITPFSQLHNLCSIRIPKPIVNFFIRKMPFTIRIKGLPGRTWVMIGFRSWRQQELDQKGDQIRSPSAYVQRAVGNAKASFCPAGEEYTGLLLIN